MTKRYYFSVKYLPAGADHDLLAGRCIHEMHLFMINNPQAMNKIGVTFPDWGFTSVGQRIAFVAESKEMLTALSFQNYFSLMVSDGLFELSGVLEVPKTVRELRFVRNQSIGKSFRGSKLRRMKRSIARASALGHALKIPQAREERSIEHFHCVPISSGSSGQTYFLFTQKHMVNERSEANFSSYGLATAQERRGTVPDLDL